MGTGSIAGREVAPRCHAVAWVLAGLVDLRDVDAGKLGMGLEDLCFQEHWQKSQSALSLISLD